MPDWLSDVVPDWVAEVMRPKKVPPPWGRMAQAVLAVWVPLAVGFATGQREQSEQEPVSEQDNDGGASLHGWPAPEH